MIVKSVNLKDVLYMVKDAWDLVASSTIQKCWKCIGFSPDSSGTQGHSQTTQNEQQIYESESLQRVEEILQTVQIVDAQLTADDVSDWLSIDAQHNGYENYSDEQIIQQVIDSSMSPITNAEFDDDEEDSPPCSNHEAVNMANTLLRWAECQPDTNPWLYDK